MIRPAVTAAWIKDLATRSNGSQNIVLVLPAGPEGLLAGLDGLGHGRGYVLRNVMSGNRGGMNAHREVAFISVEESEILLQSLITPTGAALLVSLGLTHLHVVSKFLPATLFLSVLLETRLFLYPLALQFSSLVLFGWGRLEGWQEVLMLSWQDMIRSVRFFSWRAPGDPLTPLQVISLELPPPASGKGDIKEVELSRRSHRSVWRSEA